MVTQVIENEAKEQRGGFLGMLLGTLSTSLFDNMLTGKSFSMQEKEKQQLVKTDKK